MKKESSNSKSTVTDISDKAYCSQSLERHKDSLENGPSGGVPSGCGDCPPSSLEATLFGMRLELFALHIRLRIFLPSLRLGLSVFFQKTQMCPHLWVPSALPTPNNLPLRSEALLGPPHDFFYKQFFFLQIELLTKDIVLYIAMAYPFGKVFLLILHLKINQYHYSQIIAQSNVSTGFNPGIQ